MYFLAHPTSFICSQIRLTAQFLCECRSVCLVLRRVYVARIYSLIAKILKFDWSMKVTWTWRVIVNQIRLSKRFSFEHICWKLQQTKADKYSGYYLFFSLSRQLVYFHEADYYCTILSHYLQLLENRCLKNFAPFAGKYLCRSFFLINQPATFLIRDSDLDPFLGILGNCQEHHFYRAPWNSCFYIYGTYL